MNVIFVEPCFPNNQRQFVTALHNVGATVVAIGESPKEALDGDLAHQLHEYIQVSSVCNESEMMDAVRFVQSKLWVDRLETTVEAHILPIAKVREACQIPGTTVETAYLCRDKPAMKERLRDAGLPTAQTIGSSNINEVLDFSRLVGFPLVVKPRSGAGAAGATRVDTEEELHLALTNAGVGHGEEVAVEEFVEGHEAFYDTITISGHVVHEFITHYYPNVLEAMRNRWISPQFITTNRIESAAPYQEVRELGRRAIEALAIESSATHMEWFFGKKGLKFSEIGCRPPGVQAWDLYNVANDIDLYREWAMAICHGHTDRPASRRLCAGIIALRPSQDGVISGYDGLSEIEDRYGEWIIDSHLPSEGTPTQGVEAGYMANAWIRVKHPDYDQLRNILDDIGQSVSVYAH